MHFPTAMEPRIRATGTELAHEKSQAKIESDEVVLRVVSATATKGKEIKSDELMLELRKSILLLATLVATATYAAGFNPPGGVWQETVDGHLAGDPIIRANHKLRYLVFFYCNATAFASSLLVIVLVLFLALLHEKMRLQEKEKGWTSSVMPLRVVMVLDLLSVMGAYAAGTCRDTATTVYSSVLVSGAFVYLAVQMLRASWLKDQYYYDEDASVKKRLRKVLMLLATFAVSVTYVAGMSTPGGFWDSGAEGSHRPGDAILKDRHRARLTTFLCFNTTAFVASLLIIVVLLDRKHREREAYGWITVAMVSLVGAYTAGSCRETDTTVYVASLVVVVQIFIGFLQKIVFPKEKVVDAADCSPSVRHWWLQGPLTDDDRKSADKARSLVLLLATLAATVTYQAGLDPPGGVWPDNREGHRAGDPILLTTNAKRYKAFYYCNSTAFVASLVAIILVQNELLLKTHVLEAAMVLDLFGLIGAYAAGSCRDVNTSIYAMALAGVVLVYVVIHVVFFTLDNTGTRNAKMEELVEKRRKRLLLFAVLAATITYQAGLTPPGGFLVQDDAGSSGHHAGDSVLLYNFPRRYTAFFYCNTVSFMLSIALIILLVNPHLYRPAIRSYALSVCTAAGLLGLMGAYAAGSTQHLKASIYIFVLVAVVLFVMLLLLFLVKETNSDTASESRSNSSETEATGATSDEEGKKKKKDAIHAKRKYLMLLGILVASVTYQAGLDPPGGAWQRSGDGYNAGNPLMHDNRKPRYLTFFYSNSASLVASIVVIVLLLLQWQEKKSKWSLRVMNTAILLDLLALLGAYAAGSSREWKTSLYVVALVIAVLAYVAIHVALSFLCSPTDKSKEQAAPSPPP